MSRRRNLISIWLAIALMATLFPGCFAEATKFRFAKRADAYFTSGEYEKAKIEYLNLLKLDPLNPTAILRLGLIWSEEGAPLRAVPYLREALKLEPKSHEARLKLASAYRAFGDVAMARKEAAAIIKDSPANGEAIVLLAETSRSKEEIQELKEQLASFPDPKSALQELASANLSLHAGDLAAAEEAVKRALIADPKLPLAHQAMGNIDLLRKDQPKAAEEFKNAAELAPARSGLRLQFAEFKSKTGGVEEAKQFLQEMTKRAPDYLPTWRHLAQIALSEKKYDEVFSLLENVFSRDSDNYDARILQAQAWLAKGEIEKAVDGLERLVKIFPDFAGARYQLARAYIENKHPEKATAALKQAVLANRDYVEAILLLAELNLRTGNTDDVVRSMRELLNKRPNLALAQVMLAEAYRASGRLDDSASVIREQIKMAPRSAESHLLLGLILRQQGKMGEARKAFETARELSPDDLQIVYQLVELDLAENRFDGALEKVRDQLSKNPASAPAQFMEAKVYAAQAQWDKAEAALLKTLDLDPAFSRAYDLLIGTYISAEKLDPALGQLQGLLEKKPDNARALMVSAGIYSRKGDYQKAREAYEKVLLISPNFAPAMNNLANLYSERLNQPAKAYELARNARSLAPNDPSVADTAAWIHYKRGEYQQALALSQESASKLPAEPEIQLHLGMASYMMDQVDAARAALQQAVAAPAEFQGKDDGRERLKALDAGSSTAELETRVRLQPDDVVAWMRLGQAREDAASFEQARAAYERSLQINPKLLSPLVKLAQLYAGPLKDSAKAFEFAKKGRDAAPEDAASAGILGSVAYRTGNYGWAYSLLEESARRKPNDPQILHTLAWAAYSLGRINEAREKMQLFLNLDPNSGEAENANLFMKMTGLVDEPQALALAAPEIAKVLANEPNYTPAQVAQAALCVRGGNPGAAAPLLSAVLQRFPDFAPAQRDLAAVYADDPENRAKAFDLAVKARKALPDDPVTARVLGEVNYQRKELAYAIQLLEESERKAPLPPKDLFYLGMAHWEAKHSQAAQDALRRALTAGLQEPFAGEANRVLTGLQPK